MRVTPGISDSSKEHFNNMKLTRSVVFTAAFCLLLAASFAHASTITGTVTNKTTNKPTGGDTVVLVDVQAGMGEVAKATTDSSGHYSIKAPGNGPYLVRVTHQGGSYFIAAPEGSAPGDIPVYDVGADVGRISIEADVLEVESENGQLKVTERYFVHNTSSPPRTQYDPAHGFEIALPLDAVMDGAAARRPTGLPTSTSLKSAGAKGRFMFDFPIQPDEGDKDTLFQLTYHVPYGSSKYTFKPHIAIPADNFAVLLPKSIMFQPGPGSTFQSVPEDPNIQTFLAKNVNPDKELGFTVSGTGSMPREAQGTPAGQQPGMGGSQDTSSPGNTPGGGIGNPIGTPDPLTKYKWWILGGLGLLLVVAAAFLLRKPAGAPTSVPAPAPATYTPPVAASPLYSAPPAPKHADILAVLKEEMFALESEKASGTIDAADYLEQKSAMETVLKRALKRK
jgi:hypothetical protein